MNKKGLVGGIIAIVLILFVFAIFSALAFYMWNSANNTFQNVGNETINQPTKDKIGSFTNKFMWADKVFMLLYVVLLVGYIITATATSTESPVFLVIFAIILIIFTIITMLLSNAWSWIIGAPLSSVSGYFSYTNFFMKNLPIITFFTGLIGAIIFYGRRNTGGGDVGAFE